MDWEEREFPEWRTERYEFVSKLPHDHIRAEQKLTEAL